MGHLDTDHAVPGPMTEAALQAALAWWRDAGVDYAFVDAPQDWLGAEAEATAKASATVQPPPPPPSRAPQPEAKVAPIGADRENWPNALESFESWWLSEPSLAPRGMNRVPPSGPAGAALMVLVPMPMDDDGEVLLSGKAGRLLDAMIAAMGIARADVYRASVLPARIALPDWASLGSAGLGAVLARHVALVSPQRMLVFGRADISALMGHDSAHTAHHLRPFNHESGSVPVGYEYDLETLLAKPGWKAGVWQRWLDGSSAGSKAQ